MFVEAERAIRSPALARARAHRRAGNCSHVPRGFWPGPVPIPCNCRGRAGRTTVPRARACLVSICHPRSHRPGCVSTHMSSELRPSSAGVRFWYNSQRSKRGGHSTASGKKPKISQPLTRSRHNRTHPPSQAQRRKRWRATGGRTGIASAAGEEKDIAHSVAPVGKNNT